MMLGTEVYEKYPIGCKVKRGPWWNGGEQDHDRFGNPTIGKVVGYTDTYMEVFVQVAWGGGSYNSYRPDDQIILVDDEENIIITQKIDSIYCTCSEPELVTTGFFSTFTVCKLCKKERK